MKKFFKFLNNLIFPKNFTCDICGEEIVESNSKFNICIDCYKTLPIITGKVCLRCGEEIHSLSKYCLSCKSNKREFKQCFSVFNYIPPITDLVSRLKYYKNRYLGENFSPFLLEKLKSTELNPDIIIPVPLHPHRQKERGFNQAELLCKSFIENGYNVRFDIIERMIDTEQQTTKNRIERIENVKDAFAFVSTENRKLIKDKVVLIIDDVFTTGSTLNEISKLLILVGAKEVYGLTLAHGVMEKALEDD